MRSKSLKNPTKTTNYKSFVRFKKLSVKKLICEGKLGYNASHFEGVSKDFVDRTLREYEMVKSPQKKRKGVSKYMQYPQYTLNKLGKIVMSMDFIS